MSLFIVSIPIGHPDDITLRAIETLKQVDFVVCEEIKIGRKLLKRLEIEKPLYNLNEHNETESSQEIIQLLLKNKNGAYFSDAGTPLFADPGTVLVNQCHQMGIRVIPIPGPSSLTASLSVAGVNIQQFFYAGFLPRVPEERRSSIRKLQQFNCPVVIYDTPYRLRALLDDLKLELPPSTTATLLLALTQPDEQIISGTLSEVVADVNANYKKREFVLIVDFGNNHKSSERLRKKRPGKKSGKRK